MENPTLKILGTANEQNIQFDVNKM